MPWRMRLSIVALLLAGCGDITPTGATAVDVAPLDDAPSVVAAEDDSVGLDAWALDASPGDDSATGATSSGGSADATVPDVRAPLAAPGTLPPRAVPAYGVHTANALPPDALTAFAANRLRYFRYNFGAPATPDDGAARRFDGPVRDAARRGVFLLPVLFSGDRADLAGYEAFARSVAARFGPGGSFWAENPSVPALPIRAWEVWNEPNLPEFWDGAHPAPPAAYRALLAAARRGLRTADPQARVIFAGLSPANAATRPRVFLRGVAADGGACLFDAVAIHPYAGTAEGAVDEVRAIHEELDALGLRRDVATDPQVWVTEWGWAVPADGWPSSGYLTSRGEGDQADLLGAFARAIDEHRGGWRVGPVFWFNDRDIFPYPAGRSDTWWFHCGLLRRDGSARPSWSRLGALAAGRASVPLPPVRQCAVPPVRCGDPGQPCCNGATPCPGAGVACVAGTCRRCGDPGQACCPGAMPCPGAGVACYTGTCQRCGERGQRCCPGSMPCPGARLRCRMDRCE